MDGVEVAVPSASGVDLNSVERVEVIRGPQAAGIYGSDAIGGVIQIFTQKGDTGLARPQVSSEAGLGAVQTPYAGFGSVLRQRYAAAVRGSGPGLSYRFGAGIPYGMTTSPTASAPGSPTRACTAPCTSHAG